jgi:hypothetical protein
MNETSPTITALLRAIARLQAENKRLREALHPRPRFGDDDPDRFDDEGGFSHRVDDDDEDDPWDDYPTGEEED